jgi:hypothetical protein
MSSVINATSLKNSEFLNLLSYGKIRFVAYGPLLTTGLQVLVYREEDQTYQEYLITDTTALTTTLPNQVASYSQTGKTVAVTNAINYSPVAKAGTYRMSGLVNVTAWTTPASFTVVVTYKDASGNSASITMSMFEDDGTNSAAVDEVANFFCTPMTFQIDASATAITLSTTGTFTGSPVYNLAAVLEQLA